MIVDLFKRYANIEDPNVPLTAKNITDYYGGQPSSSGAKVTHDSALGNPAIWRAVNLISLTLCHLPIKVYRRVPGGGKEEDRQHPAWALLHDMAYPGILACHAVQMTTAKAVLRGNGYLKIIRDINGRATRLDPITLDDDEFRPALIDGRVGYLWRTKGRTQTVNADDVLHIKGLHLDPSGTMGLSLVQALRDAIGLGLAAQTYGSVFFKNNAKPSMVIEVPYKFNSQEDVDEFRKRWGNIHGGLENSHRPAILEGGGKVTPLSVSNEDAQWLQLREFEVRMVANMLHVPASKLQDNTRTAYNSLEQDNKSFLEESLRPWINQWEMECRQKLLTVKELRANSHTIEFDLNNLLRTDKRTEIEMLIAQVNGGLLLDNEARGILNLPELPEAGKLRIPTSVQTSGQTDEPATETVDGMRVDTLVEIQREHLRREVARWYRRIGHHARNVAKRPLKFRTWAKSFPEQECEILVNSLRATVTTLCVLTRGSTDTALEAHVAKALADVQKHMLGIANRTDGDTLPSVVDETFTQIEQAGHAAAFADVLCGV